MHFTCHPAHKLEEAFQTSPTLMNEIGGLCLHQLTTLSQLVKGMSNALDRKLDSLCVNINNEEPTERSSPSNVVMPSAINAPPKAAPHHNHEGDAVVSLLTSALKTMTDGLKDGFLTAFVGWLECSSNAVCRVVPI